MTATPLHETQTLAATEPRLVVYVGGDAPLIEASLAPLGGAIRFEAEANVAGALMAAAKHKAHAVIVDLTKPDDARTLLVAALAAARHPPRIIVLGRRENVGELLRMPGVYCVVTFPLLPSQIRAAVTDRRSKRRNGDQPKEPPSADVTLPPAPAATPEPKAADFKAPDVKERQSRWPGWRLYFLTAGRFMTVVSNLYKNAAFVLLASLFGAFCFYGFLIAYFLLASSWGSPMTLTRGHQLVEKAVNDVGEMKVALAMNNQRLSEAELEAEKARAAFDDAAVLVDFMKGTVDAEIDQRLKGVSVSTRNAQRLEKVIKEFRAQTGQNDKKSNPKALYDKRLITRKSYDAQNLGWLEATQRLSSLEGELDVAKQQVGQLEHSLTLLMSLREQLSGKKITRSPPAAPTSSC